MKKRRWRSAFTSICPINFERFCSYDAETDATGIRLSIRFISPVDIVVAGLLDPDTAEKLGSRSAPHPVILLNFRARLPPVSAKFRRHSPGLLRQAGACSR